MFLMGQSAVDVTFLLCGLSTDHPGPVSCHLERLWHTQRLSLTKRSFCFGRKNWFGWVWVQSMWLFSYVDGARLSFLSPWVTLSHSETVFIKDNFSPQSRWDLKRISPSAIIEIMSSMAILEWRVLIGQCSFIIDWTMLFILYQIVVQVNNQSAPPTPTITSTMDTLHAHWVWC